MEQPTTSIHGQMSARLAALRRKKNAGELLHGALLSALIVLASIVAALVAEEILYLGVTARTVIFWLLVLVGLSMLVWYVGRPLLRLMGVLSSSDDPALARLVGRAFPEIHDRLVNALELFRERQGSVHYSGELIDAAFEDLAAETASIDFRSVVDITGSRRMSRLLVAGALAVILLVAVFPAPFLHSAYRLWNYGEVFAAPAPFRLLVTPGDREVVKGENVRITVKVEGEQQKEIALASKPQGQVTFENRVLRAGGDGLFTCDIENVRSSMMYFAHAGDVRSAEYVLTVTDRPMVKMLRLELHAPAYTGLPPRPLEDNVGDVTALKGTRVSVQIESNKELADARLIMHDGGVSILQTDGHRASGAMELLKEGTYHVALKDGEGTTNADPIEYTLHIIPDAYPTASILTPGMDLDITENNSLNMVFKITDDFGFSRLRLAYKLVHSRYEQPAQEVSYVNVPLPSGVGVEGTVPFTWSLGSLRLVPEDVVSYYIEVFDNDVVSGPKSAVSQSYLLRLPSLEEVFADVSKAHDVSIENLQEALKQSEEAKKELDELRQDMKKNEQKADWEDRKKAEDLAKRYRNIQKKLDEANSVVSKMLDEMQKNKVLSKETLEKYQELQQMMEQMNSPEFAEAMKQLQQAMEQLNAEAMKQALQKFQFSEENFRKSIERTMNLLKRIQIEQKVDELARRAEELMKQQKELQEKTDAADKQNPGAMNELAREQRDMKEPLRQIQNGMEDLQTKMEQFPGEMPLRELQQAQQGLDSSGLESQMDDIAQKMTQQETGEASAGQQEAMQKMSRLSQQLQATKQSLRSNQQREVMNQLRSAMQDLIELSKREEALKNQSQSLEQNSPRFRENAQAQMDVIQDLGSLADRLSGLSQKTFAVTPEMGKAIGEGLQQMGESMQSLDQRNGSMAGARQSAAMGSLNEAAQQVESAMKGMAQGGGEGMGMAGFMQRLQSLSGRQQGINQGTRNLGNLSQQQAAEMARLAGEQGAVRKSLEELAKEAANAGELRRILGNLNQIAQDMREVQTDLAQGSVNPETLQKQERILSRMLDSQLSVRERDYEKRRKAETGRNVARGSPPPFDPNSQEARTRLRNDLLRALEEGYAPDYQEVIKKYFEALEQSEQQHP